MTEKTIQEIRQEYGEKAVGAMAAGDKPSMFVLAHHGQRRADADETAFELAEAVADLRRALDPEREAKVSKAREDLEAAEGLRFDAQFKRRGGELYAPNASYWNS